MKAVSFVWPTLTATLVTLWLGLSCSSRAQPVNDLFANRILITGTNLVYTGNNLYATAEPGEPLHADELGGVSIWYSWVAPRNGPVLLRTSGSSFDTLLAVYEGTSLDNLVEIASNDEDPDAWLTSKLMFDARAGHTYQIAIDGYYGDTGNSCLQLTCFDPPQNDLFANRIPLVGINLVVSGTNVGAQREPGEPYHDGMAGGSSVWWTWVAPFAGLATISTSGSSLDTLLGVYVGSSVSNLTTIASDDESGSGSSSEVEFDTSAGLTYHIAVDGYRGSAGLVTLQVRLGVKPPPIPAPGWTKPDPYGQIVRSTDFASKVVLLNFWATWCGPCKAELPDFVELQETYGPDGLVIIGADVPWSGDNAQVVQNFLATWTPSINYPIIMADSALMQAYGGISAVPATFVIDRQNLIRKEYVGTQTSATLERQIIPLLYGNPQLAWERDGVQAILRWPAHQENFTLESASALSSVVWTAWPGTPEVINGSNTVHVPLTNANCYFRLRFPY